MAEVAAGKDLRRNSTPTADAACSVSENRRRTSVGAQGARSVIVDPRDPRAASTSAASAALIDALGGLGADEVRLDRRACCQMA